MKRGLDFPRAPGPADAGRWGDFLAHLAQKGGPDLCDYEPFSLWLENVAPAIAQGLISPSMAREIAAQGGRATTSLETLQGFARLKPHGYPGDFELMDRIYREWLSPDPALRRWDLFFQAQSAPRALRAAKIRLGAWLEQAESRAFLTEPSVHLLHLGGGPGRELLDYFTGHLPSRLVCTYLDPDPRAIAYAAGVCRPIASHVAYQVANPLGFRTPGVPHLIWAGGLFDSLDDNHAIGLLRRLWWLLPPGGKLFATHFLPRNPTRSYMDWLGWTVHYRHAAEVSALIRAAGVPETAFRIEPEPEETLLFLHLEKPAG